MIVCFGFQHPNHLWYLLILDDYVQSVTFLYLSFWWWMITFNLFIFFWWWMIASNPLSVLHLSFLMMDNYVQSIKPFAFIFFWWWMIASNPLSVLHVSFLMIDDYVQSIKFFAFIFFCVCIFSFSIYVFLLTEHIQTICARFVGPLIAAIHIFACLCDNAKLWHTFLHLTILAVLLTQTPSLISTWLFEV